VARYSELGVAGLLAVPVAEALTKPPAAYPPVLVAPWAYFSCSVTHLVWPLTSFRQKVALQSRQVRREEEHWLMWDCSLGCWDTQTLIPDSVAAQGATW